jgi:hypothetical protein
MIKLGTLKIFLRSSARLPHHIDSTTHTTMVKPGRIARKKTKYIEGQLVIKLRKQKKYKTWEYWAKEERI